MAGRPDVGVCGHELDFSFLGVVLPQLVRRRQRVNFYELLGLVDSELAADQTLAFFLDPSERHGMQTTVIDSLLLAIDGQFILDGSGRTELTFEAQPYLASPSWTVDRQIPAKGIDIPLSDLAWSGVIDIYLTNRELDIAVIIENKIWATLNNPLESYARHAVDEGYGTVLLTVLAPHEHALRMHERWASGAITYQTLLDTVTERAANGETTTNERDSQRSAMLLEQFREVRERSKTVTDYVSEGQFIDSFREALSGKEESLDQFFEGQQKLNRLFRERSQRLGPLIDERLERLGISTMWVAHGGSIKNHWAYAWNAYQLGESKNSIELILDASPRQRAPISVKAYPGRDYQYYPDLYHVPIGVDWSSSDAEIVDAFIRKIDEIEQTYPTQR